MKIAINKDFTAISKADTVRNALKAFKKNYAESIVIEEMNHAQYGAASWQYVRGNVLEMNVSGYDTFTGVGIQVEAIVFDGCTEFDRVRFYADIDTAGNWEKITTDPVLFTREKFTLCR